MDIVVEAAAAAPLNDRHLQALRRRLDRWELGHLREHAGVLATRVDALQIELAEAIRSLQLSEQTADYWREQLLAVEDMQLGLTPAGQVIPIARKVPVRIGTEWEGGIYAGVCRGLDDQPDYHLILGAAEPERELPWADALDWAKGLRTADHADWSIPNRPESSLLFANLRDLFDKAWYWTSEQYSARNAWGQWFVAGNQLNFGKSNEGRARAVRRLILPPFDPS